MHGLFEVEYQTLGSDHANEGETTFSVKFTQRIEATDPLRAGTYSMPLTLSLATTAP